LWTLWKPLDRQIFPPWFEPNTAAVKISFITSAIGGD
jgi:hypothetical protein